MTKTSASLKFAVSAVLAAAALPSLAQQTTQQKEAQRVETKAFLIEEVSPALLRSAGHVNTGRMDGRLGADRSGVDGHSIYGGASYDDIDGTPDGTDIYYEGGATSINVGMDVLLSYDGVAGLFVSNHRSDVDFTVDEGREFLYAHKEGRYDIDLNAVHAYISWGDDDKWRAWAKVGGGNGDASMNTIGSNGNLDDSDSAQETYDAELFSYAGGFRYDFTEFAGIAKPGALTADGFVSFTEVEIDGVETQANAAKLGGAYIAQQEMAERSVLDTYLAAAAYAGWTEDHDRVGYEFIAGADYRYQDRSVIGGKLRFLELPKRHKEIGVALDFLVDYRPGGLGFGARLEPSYGGSVASEWGQDELSALGASAGRLDAEIGYGLAVDGGVLKPYGGYVIDQGESYSLGVKLEQGGEDRWQLGYEAGARDEAADGYSLTY
ncbi:MAG: autotransporter domain-containing protein, partial [Betaproteobacteria bacterium AqS2]|nr:autotransporter domain-containing protein [Betaproteobacteria bacterium AqS2]